MLEASQLKDHKQMDQKADNMTNNKIQQTKEQVMDFTLTKVHKYSDFVGSKLVTTFLATK